MKIWNEGDNVHFSVKDNGMGIPENEVNRTFLYGDDIHIRMEKNEGDNKLDVPYNSKSAEKMTSKEIEIQGNRATAYSISSEDGFVLGPAAMANLAHTPSFCI